ncbi:hypothetical protein [Alkalihalophilus lindianensis]|uniref:hypothetical protein n=1 Tax=Alkalihalophilus lindianensis TaxID=1630542 RepID=UPI002936F425|nr:hypothetical protein [Alkalihalophilus lindianensis]
MPLLPAAMRKTMLLVQAALTLAITVIQAVRLAAMAGAFKIISSKRPRSSR